MSDFPPVKIMIRFFWCKGNNERGRGGIWREAAAHILAASASLHQPNWVFLLRLKIYAQPQRPCWSQNKDVNKRKPDQAGAWSQALSLSHPVDGWPCDNLTHQPPSPLCVQLHKRINKRTHINSRPVASQREQGESRAALRQCLCVTAACQ